MASYISDTEIEIDSLLYGVINSFIVVRSEEWVDCCSHIIHAFNNSNVDWRIEINAAPTDNEVRS